jgi:hypothetical protein
MGTGNYHHLNGKTIILDLYGDIDLQNSPDPQFEAQMIRDDFRHELRFVITGTAFDLNFETRRSQGRDELVLAENRLYQIWSHEDSHGHTFITYGLHEDLDPAMKGLAIAHMEDRAERFFDTLQGIYPDISVATSAWTSAPRRLVPERGALKIAA